MYNFYINSIQLPIAPERVIFKYNNRNTLINLVSGHEINLINPVGLAGISFSFILPATSSDFQFLSAKEEVLGWDIFKELELYKQGGDIVTLKIIRTFGSDSKSVHDSHYLVNIEDLSLDEDAAELGKDIRVNISFKEYCGAESASTSVSLSETGGVAILSSNVERLAAVVKNSQSYTVLPGDTLKSLARKFYGNEEMAASIYEANKEHIDSAAADFGLPCGSLKASSVLSLPQNARAVNGNSGDPSLKITLKKPSEILSANTSNQNTRIFLKGRAKRNYGYNSW